MNKILVPVDFSDASKKALEYALSIKERLSSDVVILHVTSIPTRSGTKLIQKMREAVKEEDQEMITAKYREFIQGIAGSDQLTTNIIIRYGEVSKQIANVALQEDIDLIVMGTKGATWIKEKFIGSNTFSTLKLTSVPIIVVPMVFDQASAEMRACVALRFDKLYSDQCESLVNISTMMGYTPEMMTVVDHGNESLSLSLQKDGQNYPVTIVENEKPRQGIANYLEKNKCGLLALHFNAYSFFKELTYQSVSNEFTFRSKIPILFIK